VQVVDGAIEVYGGLIAWLLRRGLPVLGPAAAMTLGHVILGRDRLCLERSRRHEHIHVRQYERWGVFMLPVYLAASAVQYMRGLDPYLDNPFEREAFGSAGRSPDCRQGSANFSHEPSSGIAASSDSKRQEMSGKECF
jgi:hypothetical protein